MRLGVTNISILFYFVFYFFPFTLRDAKFFNIAVDAEKKKQLELELQVLLCSPPVLWLLLDLLPFCIIFLFYSSISIKNHRY